eukprot:778921-Rhodomonas_salina.2
MRCCKPTLVCGRARAGAGQAVQDAAGALPQPRLQEEEPSPTTQQPHVDTDRRKSRSPFCNDMQ